LEAGRVAQVQPLVFAGRVCVQPAPQRPFVRKEGRPRPATPPVLPTRRWSHTSRHRIFQRPFFERPWIAS